MKTAFLTPRELPGFDRPSHLSITDPSHGVLKALADWILDGTASGFKIIADNVIVGIFPNEGAALIFDAQIALGNV